MPEVPARVLVFQPVFTHGAALDFRLLGVQLWLADRLTAIGLEGASALMRAPGEGEPTLAATTAPSDDDVAAGLAAHAARYGLVTSFTVLGDTPRLAKAKLAELRPLAGLRVLARWSFEGDDHLAAAALHLFVEVAARVGYVIEPVAWERVFDTSDVAAAGNYLTALGALAVIEQGFAFDEDSAEQSLRALLSGVHVGMRPAIDLLPQLVAALQEHGRAPKEMLHAAVDAARETVAQVPESWAPMLRTLGIGGALLN